MDTGGTLNGYREIVRVVLLPLTRRKYSGRDAVYKAVFDAKNDRYVVMLVGWEGPNRRVHSCLAHLDTIGGKMWIQRDGVRFGLRIGRSRHSQAQYSPWFSLGGRAVTLALPWLECSASKREPEPVTFTNAVLRICWDK